MFRTILSLYQAGAGYSTFKNVIEIKVLTLYCCSFYVQCFCFIQCWEIKN